MGSAVGATTRLEDEYVVVSDRGRDWLVDPRYASRFLYHALVPSSLATEVACRFRRARPGRGGLHRLHLRARRGRATATSSSQDGDADVVIAGATDAPISPISMACFDAIRATSARNDDPEHASRPFDATRDGFVMGEGAAVLVLEEFEHARRRGADIFCEIRGYANRCNAYHMTGLRPDGVEMAEAIDDALGQARLDPDGGRATSTRTARAPSRTTGTRPPRSSAASGQHAYDVPVSSIKSMVGPLARRDRRDRGRRLRAGDPSTVWCRRRPTWSTRDPECDLDYVPRQAREHRVDVALSVGSGFGGFQSARSCSAKPGRA